MNFVKWTEEELRIVKGNYSTAKMAELLPRRSLAAIAKKRQKKVPASCNVPVKEKTRSLERKCLCCGTKFESWSRTSNWMCVNCRKLSDGSVSEGVVRWPT